jgi:hypothetical protein
MALTASVVWEWIAQHKDYMGLRIDQEKAKAKGDLTRVYGVRNGEMAHTTHS